MMKRLTILLLVLAVSCTKREMYVCEKNNVSVSVNKVTLQELIKRGELKELRKCLTEGAEDVVNSTDDWGMNLVHWVAEHGHLEALNLLLATGCVNVNQPVGPPKGNILKSRVFLEAQGETIESNQGMSPLQLAAENGHLNVVKVLVENGAEIDARDCPRRTSLQLAAENGHLNVVRFLLENNAVVARDDGSLLQVAAGCLDILRLLLAKGADQEAIGQDGMRPLGRAAREGRVEVVRCLLAKGADKKAQDDKEGGTPLHWAAGGGHGEVVQLLVENNANVDILAKDASTPLHWAAGGGHIEVVQLLVENNANVDILAKDASTPLHWAAGGGHIEVVQLLIDKIDKGADVNALGEDGSTALHWAAKWGYLDVVKLLIEAGAEIDAKDKNKKTPKDLADESGRKEVASYLNKKMKEFSWGWGGGKDPALKKLL
ncbi:MAG: ankyrin repeat domain-containing protein [Cytophagales bacterium]|nr:ankyrin repeat domain-containing protein [Cytophagales bacterium]